MFQFVTLFSITTAPLLVLLLLLMTSTTVTVSKSPLTIEHKTFPNTMTYQLSSLPSVSRGTSSNYSLSIFDCTYQNAIDLDVASGVSGNESFRVVIKNSTFVHLLRVFGETRLALSNFELEVSNCLLTALELRRLKLNGSSILLTHNTFTPEASLWRRYTQRMHMFELDLTYTQFHLNHTQLYSPISEQHIRSERPVNVIRYGLQISGVRFENSTICLLCHSRVEPAWNETLFSPAVTTSSGLLNWTELDTDPVVALSRNTYLYFSIFTIIDANITVRRPNEHLLSFDVYAVESNITVLLGNAHIIPVGSIALIFIGPRPNHHFEVNSYFQLRNASRFVLDTSHMTGYYHTIPQISQAVHPTSITLEDSNVIGSVFVGGFHFAWGQGITFRRVFCNETISLSGLNFYQGSVVLSQLDLMEGNATVETAQPSLLSLRSYPPRRHRLHIHNVQMRNGSQFSLKQSRFRIPLSEYYYTGPVVRTAAIGLAFTSTDVEDNSSVTISDNLFLPVYGGILLPLGARNYEELSTPAISMVSSVKFRANTSLVIRNNDIRVRQRDDFLIKLDQFLCDGCHLWVTLHPDQEKLVPVGSFRLALLVHSTVKSFHTGSTWRFSNASELVLDVRKGTQTAYSVAYAQQPAAALSSSIVIEGCTVSQTIFVAGFPFKEGRGLVVRQSIAHDVAVHLLTINNSSLVVSELTLESDPHLMATRLQIVSVNIHNGSLVIAKNRIQYPFSSHSSQAFPNHGIQVYSGKFIASQLCIKQNVIWLGELTEEVKKFFEKKPGPFRIDSRGIFISYSSFLAGTNVSLTGNAISMARSSEYVVDLFDICFEEGGLEVLLANSVIPVGSFSIKLSDSACTLTYFRLNPKISLQNATNLLISVSKGTYARSYVQPSPLHRHNSSIVIENSYISSKVSIGGFRFNDTFGLMLSNVTTNQIILSPMEFFNASVVLQDLKLNIEEHWLSTYRLYIAEVILVNTSLVIRNSVILAPVALFHGGTYNTQNRPAYALFLYLTKALQNSSIVVTGNTIQPFPRPWAVAQVDNVSNFLFDSSALRFANLEFLDNSSLTVANNDIAVSKPVEHLLLLGAVICKHCGMTVLLNQDAYSVGSYVFRPSHDYQIYTKLVLNEVFELRNAAEFQLSPVENGLVNIHMNQSIVLQNSFINGSVFMNALKLAEGNEIVVKNTQAAWIHISSCHVTAQVIAVINASIVLQDLIRRPRLLLAQLVLVNQSSGLVIRDVQAIHPVSETWGEHGVKTSNIMDAIHIKGILFYDGAGLILERTTVTKYKGKPTIPSPSYVNWTELESGVAVNVGASRWNSLVFSTTATWGALPVGFVAIRNNNLMALNPNVGTALKLYSIAATYPSKTPLRIIIDGSTLNGKVIVQEESLPNFALTRNILSEKVSVTSTALLTDAKKFYALCNTVGGTPVSTSDALFNTLNKAININTGACAGNTYSQCLTATDPDSFPPSCLQPVPDELPTLSELLPLPSNLQRRRVSSTADIPLPPSAVKFLEDAILMEVDNNTGNGLLECKYDLMLPSRTITPTPTRSQTLFRLKLVNNTNTTATKQLQRSVSNVAVARSSSEKILATLGRSLSSSISPSTSQAAAAPHRNNSSTLTLALDAHTSLAPVQVIPQPTMKNESLNTTNADDEDDDDVVAKKLKSPASFMELSSVELRASHHSVRVAALASASAAIVGGAAVAGPVAADLQALLVIGSMACAGPPSRGVAKASSSKTISPVTINNLFGEELGPIVGSVAVLLGVAALHSIVTVFLWKSKKLSFLKASAAARFPNLTYSVYMLLLQGFTLNCYLLIFNGEAASSRAVGAVVLLVVTPPSFIAAYCVVKKKGLAVSYQPFLGMFGYSGPASNVEPSSMVESALGQSPVVKKIACGSVAMAKMILAYGYWFDDDGAAAGAPTDTTEGGEEGETPPVANTDDSLPQSYLVLRFGGCFSSGRGPSFVWIQPAMVLKAHLVSCIAALPSGWLSCTLSIAILGLFHLSLALLILVLKPYRIGISNVATFTLTLLTTVILLLNFGPIAASSAGASVSSMLIVVATALSVVFVVTMILLRRFEPAWNAEQKQRLAALQQQQQQLLTKESGEGEENEEEMQLQVPLLQAATSPSVNVQQPTSRNAAAVMRTGDTPAGNTTAAAPRNPLSSSPVGR